MIKLEVGQEVKFIENCWANNQLGVVTEVFETGFISGDRESNYGYIVRLVSQSSGICTNFYDFELRLSKKDIRTTKIKYLLSQ